MAQMAAVMPPDDMPLLMYNRRPGNKERICPACKTHYRSVRRMRCRLSKAELFVRNWHNVCRAILLCKAPLLSPLGISCASTLQCSVKYTWWLLCAVLCHAVQASEALP